MHVDYVFLLFVSFCGSTKFQLFLKLKKSHRKDVRIKRMVGDIYILWWLTAVSWNERVIVFSLEVTLERVCWPCKWNVKKGKSVGRQSIYRKYVSWSRVRKHRMKLKCGRSFSTDHVFLLANGFLRLNVYVRLPSLFQEQVA